MMQKNVSLVVLLITLLVAGLLFYQVMATFFVPLFLALITVVVFHPLHKWILKRVRGRVHTAALLTTLAVLLMVLIPITLLCWNAINEGVRIYQEGNFSNNAADLLDAARNSPAVVKTCKAFDIDLKNVTEEDVVREMTTYGKKFFPTLQNAAAEGTRLITSFLFGCCIMVLGIYYFFADGPQMLRAILTSLPLKDEYEERIVTQFNDVSRSVVVATTACAVAQGIVLGIGYAVCGFEALVLLTFLSMVAALVPFVGTALVWVPATIWLFANGEVGWGIGLLIYSAIIAGSVDNVLKPWILHGRSNLHPLLALLSVIGGIQALGPIGILVGPMIIVLLQTVVSLVNQELASGKEEQGAVPD